MLKIVSLVIAVLIAGVLVAAASKPDVFRVQRSASINAPPAKIYPLIDDFKRWSAWSPYEKLDPAMKRTLAGAPRGEGAVYAWEGDGKVGAGRMEITDAVEPAKVTIKLDFIKPFEARNTAEFTLVPKGDSTEVTWAMQGPNPYFAKLIHLVVDMDAMVGKDFEAGLANLKTIAEQ
jgi:uncharacterized protein YndB with AHSA1/START domain